MDLTHDYPRSVRDKVCGIVMIGRTIDKAKATAHGNVGEYHFNCPMDAAVLKFLDIEAEQLLELVRTSESETKIEAFVKEFVDEKDAREVDAFNADFLAMTPAKGDAYDAFMRLRAAVAPERTDVTTWADLLDLDERRDVPRRAAAVSG